MISAIILLIFLFIIYKNIIKEDLTLSDKPTNLINRKIDIDQCMKKYQRAKCTKIFPDTYRIYKDKSFNEYDDLLKKYNKNDWVVMKTIWGEQRKGLEINKIKDISTKKLKYYDQIQHLILNSLKIKNRVFHLRLYLVVDCNNGVYLYKDGLVIYSKEKFSDNIKKDTVITASLKSGYQNVSFYQKNKLPKSLLELNYYLDKTNLSSKKLTNNLINTFEQYCRLKNLCDNKNKTKRHIHIFGPDVLIDKDLNCIILEVNQGPALATPKKYTDSKYKELHWQYKLKNNLIKNIIIRNYTNFHKLDI